LPAAIEPEEFLRQLLKPRQPLAGAFQFERKSCRSAFGKIKRLVVIIDS
jgi:hypothetical protein